MALEGHHLLAILNVPQSTVCVCVFVQTSMVAVKLLEIVSFSVKVKDVQYNTQSGRTHTYIV